MVFSQIIILAIVAAYWTGLISFWMLLLIVGTVYWLPKFIILNFMNYFAPKIIMCNKEKRAYKYGKKFVSLTFDDVPYISEDDKNSNFPHDRGSYVDISGLLSMYGMKGTFFVISDYVTKGPKNTRIKEILTTIVKNGHQLGNHGKTNSPHAFKSVTDLNKELIDCDNLIKEIYNSADVYKPKFMAYRPGCGLWNSSMFDLIKKINVNYEIVLGNVHPFDTISIIPYLNYLYLKYHMSNGDIIVLHDRPWTPTMLNYLLPWMKENGYVSITLDELFSK
ncbi:MAG: hypothetical protein Terrestrivirus3_183 [Terrestrivirus sp.]|uniref:NodB homology domain-containing protein n=1 Tax=Terrestrivirus sp. TaxID=2487775 RepID=A0A3G4ZND2_9VIRU|nr:MAG: hypothetical protein Terrestrivirus3_183 [Terrestrivirus sp.]